ncbi:beta-lactamase [Legionella norrlandica]|uniref:Beta-lactamase n=1 Tax=Legionella norrlandica TaxID=1498499 RepID=A0A0A2TAJ8_9GAMM|nr:penicillin-binding transpeptidase domain-containing protein [Legionella norrlandica]KGP64413.1 beta-lactamase [Legionella norrlandica]
MKKLIALFLVACFINTSIWATKESDYSKLFKKYHACFILYDLNNHKIVSEYNPNQRCSERIAPDSTFKIPLSLMAFNQGIINQHTVFKWDGVKEDLVDWNHDQTPESWLKYSVVWVSQQITRQMGDGRIKYYLAGFDYGNQDFSGDPGKNNGLTHAWLSSSLKISAMEQLTFLKAMLNHELPLTPEAIKNTCKNMYLGKLENGASYYGKTGSGRHGRNERQTNPSRLRDGWFVGFIEKGKARYIFVSNLTDKEPVPMQKFGANTPLLPYGSALLKPITLQILNNYFSSQE